MSSEVYTLTPWIVTKLLSFTLFNSKLFFVSVCRYYMYTMYTSARGLVNTKETGGVLSEHPNLRGGEAKKSKQRDKKGSRARKNEEEEENN